MTPAQLLDAYLEHTATTTAAVDVRGPSAAARRREDQTRFDEVGLPRALRSDVA